MFTVKNFYGTHHDLVDSYNVAVLTYFRFNGLSQSILRPSKTGFSFSLTYSTDT